MGGRRSRACPNPGRPFALFSALALPSVRHSPGRDITVNPRPAHDARRRTSAELHHQEKGLNHERGQAGSPFAKRQRSAKMRGMIRSDAIDKLKHRPLPSKRWERPRSICLAQSRRMRPHAIAILICSSITIPEPIQRFRFGRAQTIFGERVRRRRRYYKNSRWATSNVARCHRTIGNSRFLMARKVGHTCREDVVGGDRARRRDHTRKDLFGLLEQLATPLARSASN